MGLNSPIKRHTIAKRIKKQGPIIYCLHETQPRFKETHKLKMKELRKILHANDNQKKAVVVILILDKTGLKSKVLRRDIEKTSYKNKMSISGKI